jgi:hypothetical protein
MRTFFNMIAVGQPEVSSKGHPFIRCQTRKGYWIGFWGQKHIASIQAQSLPFRVSCNSTPTTKFVYRKTGITGWVGDRYELKFWSLPKTKECLEQETEEFCGLSFILGKK